MAAPGFSTPSHSAARIYGGSVTVTRAIFGSLRWETKWFVGPVLDLDLLFFDGGCTPKMYWPIWNVQIKVLG